MKIAAVVFSVLLVVALVGFGLSVVVTGEGKSLGEAVENSLNSVEKVALVTFGDGYGEDMTWLTADDFLDIEISAVSAEVSISFTSDETVSVDYQGNNSNVKLTAEVSGGKLIIKEHSKISFPFFGGFNFKSSILNVKIPQKQYKDIELSTISGSMEADGLLAENFLLHTTSGEAELSVFADKIEVDTISGDITLNNCTDKSAASVTSNSTSGTIVIKGYRPGKFEISSISGDTEMYGAAGKGSVNLTSGYARLDYDEWNNSLAVSAISGEIEVNLPENSGINLDFSRISGEAEYDLDGDSGDFNKSGTYSVGGSNKQEVKASFTSGSVSFKNK